jgi:hypothetical protein
LFDSFKKLKYRVMKNKLFLYISKSMSLCLVLTIIGASSIILTSCESEEDFGTPRITNIRTTNPETANVSLDHGNLGQMVVIQGENLGSTHKVFFNNVEAFVNPAYVTNTNIIIRVPSEFPSEINDMIRVITKGGEATYNFPIDIPEPLVTTFPLEWVPEGGTLTINGQFFYNVETIEFTGGVTTSTFTVVNPQKIEVIVPADVQSGPVKVHAVAGTATSKVWFRDNRNMMVDFMDHPICWGGDAYVVNASDIPAHVPVTPINGNFYYIKKDYAGGTWWIQETVIAYCGDITVPAPKSNYALAFEMWVGEKWDKNWFEIEMFGDAGIYFEWKGWEILGGDAKSLENTGWMTVKIPLESMTALTGTSFRLSRFGSYKAASEDLIEFAFDNFRFTPLN